MSTRKIRSKIKYSKAKSGCCLVHNNLFQTRFTHFFSSKSQGVSGPGPTWSFHIPLTHFVLSPNLSYRPTRSQGPSVKKPKMVITIMRKGRGPHTAVARAAAVSALERGTAPPRQSTERAERRFEARASAHARGAASAKLQATSARRRRDA